MPKEEDYLSALECLDLREAGYPQGESDYLWLQDKRYKDKWSLYKRNPYDNSENGDVLGYNRWVSAVTVRMAQLWQNSKKKKLSPILMTKKHVDSLTFNSNMIPDPRKSAAIFASCYSVNDLISITQTTYTMDVRSTVLEVTVFFWKEGE